MAKNVNHGMEKCMLNVEFPRNYHFPIRLYARCPHTTKRTIQVLAENVRTKITGDATMGIAYPKTNTVMEFLTAKMEAMKSLVCSIRV